MSKKATTIKETETTAVATAPAGAVPAIFNPSDWGVPTVSARDIVIPKILAMQGLSKKVTDGEAVLGEFRDSLNNAKLGDTKNPIEFIPFYMEKVWIVFEDRRAAGAQLPNFKFIKTVAIDSSNENWPYEEVLNGVLIRRDRTMNFYCLLPAQVKDGTGIPHVLSFRRTSLRAGQKLATTMFMKNIKAGKTPASMVMEISGTKTSNDKGTFIVLDVKEKRASTEAEVAEAFNWVKAIRTGTTKVDDSDLQAEATTYTAQEPVDGSDQY